MICLSRNFGQQPAYRAGLEAAKGNAVVFLDADLQDPPELVGALIEKWRLGFRVVTAVRKSRAETGLRRMAFSTFHILFHRLTEGVMPENSGMFALLDRVVVNHLLSARETNLFLPALKNWFGYSQTTIEYDRSARAVGEPKQSFRKLFNYALNGIISFSEKPLQWIGVIGLFVSIASFAYAAMLVLAKIVQWLGYFPSLEVKGFTTVAAGMFCLGGVQLCCLGILGQYIARIYREVKQRPLYVIEKVRRSNEE
jgi:dolichol-phosphate mannosyltransferase